MRNTQHMKIAIITDTHAGARADSPVFADYQDRFYKDIFFPYLQSHGIKTILHLGDFFERRKYSNHETLHRVMESFIKPLEWHGITMHLLVGNHDIALRNSNLINSPELFLAQSSHIVCYREPKTVQIGGRPIHMIPWINAENFMSVMEYIKSATPSLMVGHFDISGFQMHKDGMPSEHGLDMSVFRNQRLVLSGHFHTQSKTANIQYVGNPFEFTWSDYDDPRGFWTLDTETLEMEFVRNTHTMFYKIVYTDGMPPHDPAFLETLKDKMVKIIVSKKSDPYQYDMWIEKIYAAGPFEVSVVDASMQLDTAMTEEEIKANAKSTDQIIRTYCDSMHHMEQDERVQVRDLLVQLYQEAIDET